jgi:hypothetical protein
LTTQTKISYSANNSTVLVAKFPTAVGAIVEGTIPAGLWDMNIYAATSSTTNAPSFYWSLYQVDSDGASNPVLVADGAANVQIITNLVSSQTQYNQSLYVPNYLLPATKRLSCYLYVVYQGGNRTATFEFRNGAVSHIHTSIIDSAHNWSEYPAVSDVNLSNYSISNVATLYSVTARATTGVITPSVSNTGNLALTSGTSNVNISALNVLSNDAAFITSTSSVREQHTVDRGGDLTDFAYYNVTAQGGKAGSINFTATGNSYEITPGTDGAVGGVININATTPVVTGPILTSALKMSAAGVNLYAGSFSSVGSLAGNMYLWSQLGTTLQCSPTPPATTYVGQVYVYGSNGTVLDGITYAKEIRNYGSNNLNIHPVSPYFVDMTRVQFIGMGNASNASLSNKVIRGDGTSILYDFGQVSSSGGDFTTLITQAIYNSGTGIGVSDLTIRAYGGLFSTNYSLNLAASCNINMNPANGGSVNINNGNLTLNSNSITGVSNFTGIGTGTVSGFLFSGLTGTGNITGFSNISNATALAITTPLLTITCNAEFAGGYLSMGNHMIDNISTAYFSGGGNIVGTSGNLTINGAPAANLTLTNTSNTITMTASNMTISNTSFPIILTNGYNTWTLGVSDTDIYSGAGTATLRTSFRPIYISNGYTTLVLDSNIYASALSSNSITITNTANSLIQNSNTALTTTGTMTISNTSNSLVQNANTTITTSNAMTISNANASIVMPGASGAVATGGTITYEYGRKFHTFTTDGTFTVTDTGGVTFEIMVLAGGGGGGCQSGGGGGAGGMLIFENSLSNTSYSVVVGGGGDGGVFGVVPGYLGFDSTFGTIATAYGGGGGGTYGVSVGRDGGCGGGGSELGELAKGLGTMGVVSSGTVISNLYYDGGDGFNTGSMGGAGGGGTSAVGGSQTGANSVGADGGAGTLYYGTYYGGGGGGQGGGTYNPPYTDIGGTGGVGGGGNGGISTANGDHATGYGSGGGGGGTTGGRGGDGSAGIVIISYPYSSLNLTSTSDMLVTSPNTFITGDLVIGGSLTVTATTAGDLDLDGNNILNVGNFNGFVSSVIQNPGYLQMYENTFTGLNGTRTYQIYGTTGWDGSAIKVGNLPAGCYNVSFVCTNNFRRHLSATLTTPGAAVATATTPAGNPPVAICFNSNDIDASNYVVVTTRTTLAGSVYRMYIDFTNGSSGGGDDFIMSIVLNSGQWDGTMGWVYP